MVKVKTQGTQRRIQGQDLNAYANIATLTQYFPFYNAKQPHQTLGYETPDRVRRTGIEGGALNVDKFGDALLEHEQDSCMGQRRAAAEVETDIA